MNTRFEIIETTNLSAVVGGAEPPPTYNGEDLKNALKGGLAGAEGGPPGVIVGAGAGLMKRNAGNLLDASVDLFKAWRQGNKLDKQLQELQQKKTAPQPAPQPQ
jgi:hypothetical protein